MLILVHLMIWKSKTLVACFALMMLVLSVIVDEEYMTCLSEDENKWVIISFLSFYAHAAAVGFFNFIQHDESEMSEKTDQQSSLIVNEDVEERPSEF
jgi:hypothetical protein